MAQIETWLRCDLERPVIVQQLTGNVFAADVQGNLIGVIVKRGEQDVALSGSVIGYIIRGDGATVVVNGTVSGNRVSIVLPQSAYTVVGPISIAIRLVSGDVKTVLGACTGYVYRTTTDTIVDPGHVIPSIEELLAKIEDCERAAAAANAAAGSANTAAGTANTAAGNANTAAGTANTAAAKIDNMTADAESLASSEPASAVVTEISGHKHVHFGVPRGVNGRDGVISSVDLGMFAVKIDENGHLIVMYNDNEDPPPLSINSNGHLIYTIE